MSLQPVRLQPGIYKEDSELEAGSFARWTDGNRVRFWKGKPQPIGGWQKTGVNQFDGIARGMRPFTSLDDITYLAVGTHTRLYIWYGGTYYNITPLDFDDDLTDPFSTTDTETTIDVAHTGHGRKVGDTVMYSGASAVGGVTIDGAYTVTAVTDADNYQIEHTSAATSTAGPGGGTVATTYELTIGAEDALFGFGYGAGTWGAGSWSTPRTGSILTNYPRTWSMDGWGEDLIVNPFRGGIYAWDTSGGTGARAAVITNAPTTCRAIMTSNEARHLIAFGAHDGSADDALNIRWCDSEDYTDWTATSTNTAGSKRLQGGSEIRLPLRARGEIAILTDYGLHTMRFIGGNTRFAFDDKGSDVGVISTKAGVAYRGVPYWMGAEHFYGYNGLIEEVPCDVHKYVFEDINLDQASKVFAGINNKFSEVTWWYPSADSDEIDRYVSYNVRERHWSIGELDRTSWIDDQQFSTPLAPGPDGYLYAHETGRNAEAAGIGAHIESGFGQMGNGDNLMLLRRLVPDFDDIEGTIDLYVAGRRLPKGTETEKGPFTVTPTTEQLFPRLSGRQHQLRIEATDADSYFRLGGIRADLRPMASRR